MLAEEVIIYTDGSYYNDNGGWAFAIGGEDKVLSYLQLGAVTKTTSQRMELYAVYQALFYMPTVTASKCMYCGESKIFKYHETQTGANCVNGCNPLYMGAIRKRGLHPITLYSDSQYVVEGFNNYMFKWQTEDWKTSTNQAVKNKYLWQNLLRASAPHIITMEWVKGHSGVVGNELVDEMATHARHMIGEPGFTEKAGMQKMDYNWMGVIEDNI